MNVKKQQLLKMKQDFKLQLKAPPWKIMRAYLHLELRRLPKSWRMYVAFIATMVLYFAMIFLLTVALSENFNRSNAKDIAEGKQVLTFTKEGVFGTVASVLAFLTVLLAIFSALSLLKHYFRDYAKSRSDILFANKGLSRFWLLNLRNFCFLAVLSTLSFVAFLSTLAGLMFLKETLILVDLSVSEAAFVAFKMGLFLFASTLLLLALAFSFYYIKPWIGISALILFSFLAYMIFFLSLFGLFTRSGFIVNNPIVRFTQSTNIFASDSGGEHFLYKWNAKAKRIEKVKINKLLAKHDPEFSEDYHKPLGYYLQPLSLITTGRNFVFDQKIIIYDEKTAGLNDLKQIYSNFNTVSFFGVQNVINFNRLANTKAELNYGSLFDDGSFIFVEAIDQWAKDHSQLLSLGQSQNFYQYYQKIRESKALIAWVNDNFGEFLSSEIDKLPNRLKSLLGDVDRGRFNLEKNLAIFAFLNYLNVAPKAPVLDDDNLLRRALPKISKESNDQTNLYLPESKSQNVYGTIINGIFNSNLRSSLNLLEIPDQNSQDLSSFALYSTAQARGIASFSSLALFFILGGYLGLYFGFIFKKGY